MSENTVAAAISAMDASESRRDPDYPLFHVAPPVGRLNDPNGLIHWHGEYHTFYQFSPFHPDRKLVYWGHASSPDLTRWQHHTPALAPDSPYDRDGVYSGTAFMHASVPHFAYTGNVRFPDGGRSSSQCLARSYDLETFTKDDQNPVIPEPPAGYTQHLRDPQVWQDADGSFRMCLGAQRFDETGCALLYRSTDLQCWNLEGELNFPDAEGLFDALGYMWECPALIRVPDESGDLIHDVLLFCPQGAPPRREGFENVFPACYAVGRLEGTSLRGARDFYEIDRGFEFYAPQVFTDPQPGNPTVMQAWAGNAAEDDQPSMRFGWVHLMSLARELRVRDGRLVQRPLVDLSEATDSLTPRVDVSARPGPVLGLSGSRAFALTCEVDTTPGTSWTLRIGSDSCHIQITLAETSLTVDRSQSRYPHGEQRRVTLDPATRRSVEVFHDRSVTEIFLDGGALAFTLRSYVEFPDDGVTLSATGGVVAQDMIVHRFD